MTKDTTTDLSAELFIELQRLNGAISLFRSYSGMAGFIPQDHYGASHVSSKQERYSAEQWLSDYFANKTGLIPSFLDMNQCVPQSPEAAAKTIATFLEGMEQIPELVPRDGSSPLSLFDALRADITRASKSRKLMQGRTIMLTDEQKTLGLGLIDEIEAQYVTACKAMTRLLDAYRRASRSEAG